MNGKQSIVIKGFTGTIYDVLRINPFLNVLISMTHLQSALYEGNAYSISQRTAISGFDIAAPMSFLITTPDSDVRALLLVKGIAGSAAFWELFEDTGVIGEFNVTGGTAVIPINRDRNSAKTSGLVITKTPTVTAATDAALIASGALGSAAAGEELQGYILKPDTKYLARASSYGNNNEGSLTLSWDEREFLA